VPLVAGAILPATAAQKGHVTSSGSFASIQFEGAETSDAIPGNYVWGVIDIFDGMAMGYGDTFQCEEGQTPDDCEWLGEVYFDGYDVTVTTGKGKTAPVSVNGELFVYPFSYDEEPSEEPIEPGTVTISATLSPYGKAARMTSSGSYRDGDTGESSSYRFTQNAYKATVTGSLGDLSLDDSMGYVGTYRGMDRWSTP
jgi:hypothetical protein